MIGPKPCVVLVVLKLPYVSFFKGGIKYQLVSCFKTTQKKLTQLLITERDPANSAWNGRFVDWHNWSSYMDEFLDRCATKAKSKSLRVFGVSKYGEHRFTVTLALRSGSFVLILFVKLHIITYVFDLTLQAYTSPILDSV